MKKFLKEKIDYYLILVWMEICFFIKGLVEVLLSENGVFLFEDYMFFGKKKVLNFLVDRKVVYDLFCVY